MAVTIKLKRAYEAPESSDGLRILVDRLWPRGISKADAAIDEWNKEVAPSNELRQWFGHDPARWNGFAGRYVRELAGKQDQLQALRTLARTNTITLLYGARDEQHNQAIVLRNVLLGKEPTAAVRTKLAANPKRQPKKAAKRKSKATVSDRPSAASKRKSKSKAE